MKLQFWSVGKTHEPHVKEGIEMFTKRTGFYYPVEWRVISPLKNAAALNNADTRIKEGDHILTLLKKDDFLVLLDERGKQLSSEGLAAFIQQRANEGAKSVIFLIGGAFGVSEAVIRRSDFTWSLSNLVFPHQLVRMILAEQVYRACTINKNEKYHHS